MSYQLTYPDGSKEMLLDVPKYNYGWQWLYYPTKPIDVPAGSRLDVTAVWNNSEGNPANPDPTKRSSTVAAPSNADVRRLRRSDRQGRRLERSKPPRGNSCSICWRSILPRVLFLVDGCFRMAFHAPRKGEGWLYLPGAFSITLDDFEWSGDRLKITTQFPTQEASATTTTIEGAIQADGRFQGTLVIGSDTEKPQTTAVDRRGAVHPGGHRTGARR